MRTITILFFLTFMIGCLSESKKKETANDDVKEFMKDVFDEDWQEGVGCDALIADTEIAGLCIAKQSDFKVNKDIENPLICIYILTSENSTVDIAINKSPLALLTGTIFTAAKSDANKKGKTEEIKGIGKKAFYHESKYSTGDYAIQNKDLVFYNGKVMYTLHTASGSRGTANCMSDKYQLKILAQALLKAASK